MNTMESSRSRHPLCALRPLRSSPSPMPIEVTLHRGPGPGYFSTRSHRRRLPLTLHAHTNSLAGAAGRRLHPRPRLRITAISTRRGARLRADHPCARCRAPAPMQRRMCFRSRSCRPRRPCFPQVRLPPNVDGAGNKGKAEHLLINILLHGPRSLFASPMV
jgi:hypothetical protein